jgi:hypothetical protein
MLFKLSINYNICDWNFHIISDAFPSSVDIHIIIQNFQVCKPILDNLVLFFDFHIILIMQSSPSSCPFFLHGCKYCPYYPVPLMWETALHQVLYIFKMQTFRPYENHTAGTVS